MSNNSNYNDNSGKLAGRLTNIVLLGFFSTICSLPVVTIGAALTALNVATKAYMYEGDDKPLRIYFASFKKHFSLSTRIWLLHILAYVILIWDYVYYRTSDSTLDILASLGIFLTFAFLVFETTMVFVVIAEEKSSKVFETIKIALDIAMTSPMRSAMILFLEVAVIVVSLIIFRGLLLIVPGIVSFLAWQIIPEMLKNYKFRNSERSNSESL
ncbi:MAG: YesL family protein [Erysipelotrichaceae bacterium]|nr:YesL family protein [Erysipelotrichaceae bacterium]